MVLSSCQNLAGRMRLIAVRGEVKLQLSSFHLDKIAVGQSTVCPGIAERLDLFFSCN